MADLTHTLAAAQKLADALGVPLRWNPIADLHDRRPNGGWACGGAKVVDPVAALAVVASGKACWGWTVAGDGVPDSGPIAVEVGVCGTPVVKIATEFRGVASAIARRKTTRRRRPGYYHPDTGSVSSAAVTVGSCAPAWESLTI